MRPGAWKGAAGRGAFLRMAARRLARALLAYALCAFGIAALLNVQLDVTAEAQIYEEANAFMMGPQPQAAKGKSAEERAADRLALIESLRHAYGLDRPWLARVADRARDILLLEVGGRNGSPAGGMRAAVLEALGHSLVLLGIATLAAILAGVALGTRMARKPGGLLDRISSMAAMLLFGTPTWWVASFLLMYLVYQTGLFPFGRLHSTPLPEGLVARFLDRASYLVLPVASIAFIRVWGIAYMTRSIVILPLQEDYVMAARGRGLPERKVVYGHGLRCALPGIATTGVQYLVGCMGGDIIVEKIFAYPGIGLLFWESITRNRTPMAAASLAALVGLSCLAYAFLDILYGFLDPRIRRPGHMQRPR